LALNDLLRYNPSLMSIRVASGFDPFKKATHHCGREKFLGPRGFREGCSSLLEPDMARRGESDTWS
jgi:hypothetical protein